MNAPLSDQLGELQQTYAKGLIDKIDALEEAWNSIRSSTLNFDVMRDVHRMAHSLAGSGKTFGYPAISAGAQGIERVLECALSDRTAVTVADMQKIDRLLGHLRRAAESPPAHGITSKNTDNRFDQSIADSQTILVVDDDPNIRSLLKIKLEALGLRVISAYDGQEGYAKALSKNPDLIITDHNMPNCSSDHMISNIRGSNITKDIPVIIITAQKINGRKDYALQRELTGRCGAISYLEKPLDFEALLTVIKSVLPIQSQS